VVLETAIQERRAATCLAHDEHRFGEEPLTGATHSRLLGAALQSGHKAFLPDTYQVGTLTGREPFIDSLVDVGLMEPVAKLNSAIPRSTAIRVITCSPDRVPVNRAT
jgi:hypothetical protein